MSEIIIAGIVVLALLIIALVVLMLISSWKIFVKAGRPGWNALIPIYSTVIMLEFLSMPLWLVVIAMMPLASIAVWIVMSYRLARAFGKGGWFAVGLILVPFIFYPILAFGRAQYMRESIPTGIDEATKWTMFGATALGILYTLSAFAPALLGGTGGLSIISGGAGYATDGRHVYQYDLVIPGADPSSFTPLSDYYAVDSHSVYYEGVRIHGADAASFEILGDGSYAKDARGGYHGAKRISSEPDTFTMPGNYVYAIDRDHVYVHGEVLLGADPDTFWVPDAKDYYALDASNVYYEGMVVEGADVATFELELGSLGGLSYDAKDKHRYYYYGFDAREYEGMYE